MKYVLIRTRSAGVFAGYLKNQIDTVSGLKVTITSVRRIWYWAGAASLSQLAVQGTTKPNECKFPVEVPSIDLPEVIEILDVSEKAQKSIKNVPIWQV